MIFIIGIVILAIMHTGEAIIPRIPSRLAYIAATST